MNGFQNSPQLHTYGCVLAWWQEYIGTICASCIHVKKRRETLIYIPTHPNEYIKDVTSCDMTHLRTLSIANVVLGMKCHMLKSDILLWSGQNTIPCTDILSKTRPNKLSPAFENVVAFNNNAIYTKYTANVDLDVLSGYLLLSTYYIETILTFAKLGDLHNMRHSHIYFLQAKRCMILSCH